MVRHILEDCQSVLIGANFGENQTKATHCTRRRAYIYYYYYYCAGDKIENEMGEACGTYGGRGVHKVLVGKPEGKETIGETKT